MRLSRWPGKKPISIIVADANVMASRFVCARLTKHSQFRLAGCAATVGELLKLFARRKAAVALISATLQDGWMSGLAAFPQLQEKYPDVRLILMIDHPEPKLVLEAFRAGARGIFTRYESQFDALRKCISCVHGGQVWVNAQQLDWLVNAVAQTHTVRLVNVKGFDAPADRHTHRVAHKIPNVVVFEESRIVGERRALFGIIHIALECNQTLFPPPVGEVVYHLEGIEIPLFCIFRPFENAANASRDAL